MLLGGRIHRKIQRQMGSGYHAEVPLQMVVPCEKLKIVVEGRADGIIEEKDRIAIDEIKGVLMDLEMVKEPKMVHLAQAKCYACIYAKKRNLDEIRGTDDLLSDGDRGSEAVLPDVAVQSWRNGS